MNGSGGDSTEITDDSVNALQLKNLIRNSGMAFEWQLLAWYRSGMDSGRLYTLLHEDLKGILINLSNRLKKNKTTGTLKKKLELLRKNAQAQVKNITNRQIANILSRHGIKKGFYLELPSVADQKQGYVRIIGKGNNDSEEEKNPDSLKSPFSLEIEIELSKIGTVNVFMTFSGKTVSLNFELDSEKIFSTVKDMSEELRAKLAERGFVVSSVEFNKHNDSKSSSTPSKHPKTTKAIRKLDIIG